MNHDLRNMCNYWLSLVVIVAVACGAGVEAFATDTGQARREYPWKIGPQNGLDSQTGGHWFNLGPTGIRAKIAERNRREFLVKYVFADSPAAGKIYVDDKIIGVNGRKFRYPELFSEGYAGPRMELGKAIEESEGDPKLGGRLTFMLVRAGKSMDVVIQLRRLGYFSKTYPFNCKKSEILIAEACKWLTRPVELKSKPRAANYTPGIYINGHWHTQISCKLALMAQGDTYMPLLKEHYRRRAETDDGKGASEYTAKGDGMWVYCEALQMIELAEWYMLTGDRTVLAPLKYHESVVVYCQNPNGGFEHGKVKNIYPKMSFPAGLACIGWALMKQAGLQINRAAYITSRNALTLSTQPSGEIWYDVSPLSSRPNSLPNKISLDAAGTRDSSGGGRAATATLMHFLDPRDSCSESYVRRGVAHLAACADKLMDGHASAALNAQWSFAAMGIAPVIGDMKSYRQMMDYYKYWFNLNRCHDGSFYAPACTAGAIDPFIDVHYITTGWVILALSAPKRSLGILGRDPFIPGVDKAALSPPAAKVYEAIRSGKAQPAAILKAIASLKASARDKEREILGLLEALVTKPMLETLAEMDTLASENDMYKLSEDLWVSDRKYKGHAEYDTRTTPLRTALGKPDSQKVITAGRTFYTRVGPLYEAPSNRPRRKGTVLRITQEFVASEPCEPYLGKAKALAAGVRTELDKALGEVVALQKEGDLFLASKKLLEVDNEYSGFPKYLEKAAQLREALGTPESKKQKVIGGAYYRLAESVALSKGRLLQLLDEFIQTNSENRPYALMARRQRDGLILDMEVLVNRITEIKDGGDVYDAWRKLVEADREYRAFSVYVEKTEKLKAELKAPANRALMRAGALYYRMVDAVTRNPSDKVMKGIAGFIKNNEGNYYGEKAKSLIATKK